MRLLTICMLSVVGFVAALPVENGVAVLANTDVGTRNSVLEGVVLGIIEDLRQAMINGGDDFPVLEPLELDQINLQLDDLGLENSHLEAADIVVAGLSTFVIAEDFSLASTGTILQIRYTLDMNAHIPLIDVDAKHYDLSVNVLGFTIFGIGEAKIKLIEPSLKLNAVVAVSLLGGISIVSADASIGLTAFESALTGVFNDDYLNDFINLFLGELVPQLLEFFEDEISVFVSNLIVEIGNQILNGLTINDLFTVDEIQQLQLAGIPVPEVAAV